MTASPSAPPPALGRWYAPDAHHRLAVAGGAALVVIAVLCRRVNLPTLFVVGWDVFAGANVLMAWVVILTEDPHRMRQRAGLEDASRTVLFFLVVAAAVASLIAVFLTLGMAKNLPHAQLTERVLLSIAAVALAWSLVHTVFALRYAHHYYTARDGGGGVVKGGLIFPGLETPDFLDFAYFSFVVGMTCQVSDVQIASRSLRRMALWHGMIAFTFNTAILALVINIVAGLL